MGSMFSSVAAVIHDAVFPTGGAVNSLDLHNDRPPRSEEQRDASIVRHARSALLHYNSKNPGAEFDLVKPLMAASVLFRGATWFHVSFWARRRGAPPETPFQQFFGELHYTCTCNRNTTPAAPGHCTTPVVETCAIVSKLSTFQPPLRTRKKKKPRRSVCALCPRRFEIFHPKKGKFVCGKEEAHEKEFIWLNNFLEMPFTCTAS